MLNNSKVKREEMGIILSDRQARIYDFLSTNPVGVLSMITPENRPHGVVIYFTIDKHFRVRFLTKTETNKYHDLERNPHVMLTVCEPQSQATVQVSGSVKEVHTRGAIDAVAGAITGASARLSQAGMPPIYKLNAGDYTVFEIKPDEIRMAVYARPDPGGYDDLFESIESFELYES